MAGGTRYSISRRGPDFVERDVVVNTEGDSVVVVIRGIASCEHESLRGWTEGASVHEAEMMDIIGAAIQGTMAEWNVVVSVFVTEPVDTTSGMAGHGITNGGDDIIRTLKFLANMRKQ